MATDTTSPDEKFNTSQTSNPEAGAETLTPLEQEVLDEYARLVGNLNNLSTLLSDLSTNPSADVLDGLRKLERKTSLVFTLLKSSVYSIVMNQQAFEGEDGDGEGTVLGAGMGEGGEAMDGAGYAG